MSSERQYKVLSLEDRTIILRRLEKGKNAITLAKKFGLGNQQ
jgi:hypothetical protein